MGAYASFPLLALTNHAIVQMAKVLAGVSPEFRGYAVVGDDVVISGRKVAEAYIEILAALGVPINHRKVVVGFKTFEFCRRIVKDGHLVSVPSWNSIHNAVRCQDPSPLVSIFDAYGRLDLLPYPLLRSFFGSRATRNMLALNVDIHLLREPTSITRIPYEIVTHAERVLDVRDKLSRAPIIAEQDDPYLKRLTYESKIRCVFNSTLKKLRKKHFAF